MSVTNDFSKRVNSIIIKNLPADFTQKHLEELFSRYGRVLNSRIVSAVTNNEGSCGFISYADEESCEKAVQQMDNFVMNGSTIRVNHTSSRTGNSDRLQGGSRSNGEFNTRTALSASVNLDERNHSSPGQLNSFRSVSEQATKFTSNHSTDQMNNNKPLWNSNIGQEKPNSLSPNVSALDIDDHEPLVSKKTYNVYLSNVQVPNVVFASTLDDYINATLLITQMNKHEQLMKVKANSYKTKLVIGQICAALHNRDWCRARVVEVGENRVRVQFIDWGNTSWCDTTLEIRPLPSEYFKDRALCLKCILDDVPAKEKLPDDRASTILNILPLDTRLEMVVVRIENGLPCIRLHIGERDLNNEIRTSLSSLTAIKASQTLDFNSQKIELDLSTIHFVQLTIADPQIDCFHVVLMRDSLVTIMNVLKDWNATKQPFTHPPKPNTLVCAQYELDDLWYRAWIKSVNEKDQQYHVYFVDFGNEEIVPMDRLSGCPESLRTIPWQSVQIKLANVNLTDEERQTLLRDFEIERLEMKILQKNQEIYSVDLLNNGKSLVEYILELRKKQPMVKPVPSLPPPVNIPPKPAPAVEQKNDHAPDERLNTLIAEQQRQNHLLQQVLAAINTTNSLLTQLVQR